MLSVEGMIYEELTALRKELAERESRMIELLQQLVDRGMKAEELTLDFGTRSHLEPISKSRAKNER